MTSSYLSDSLWHEWIGWGRSKWPIWARNIVWQFDRYFNLKGQLSLYDISMVNSHINTNNGLSPVGRNVYAWRPEIATKINENAWWRHQMEISSALLALCEGNSPITGEFPSQKGQWREALMFSLICTWVNNRSAGDLRRHRPIMMSL